MRDGKGFRTVECYTDLSEITESADTILLECMSNLTANVMFSDDNENAFEKIVGGILNLKSENIVIVTNEISSDGIEYDGDTKMYISLLGRINSALSKRADKVYEVVYGIPIEIKRDSKMNIIKSICVAFSMYSKIPMPRVEWNEKNMKYAMCFFPLVGAVIGGLMLLVRFLCGRFGFNTSVYAVVMTALPVLVSGGIHTDGFIDTVDALSSYGDKEKKLEILKDPHTGAFAIIGAVMYYLLFSDL